MTASTFVEAPSTPSRRLIGIEFLRYFGCSVVALGTDLGLFSLGLRLGLGYPVAAAGGFVVGLMVAYGLSVRFVFQTRAVDDERVEFILFAAIGLAGLILTEVALWLLVGGGVSPMPAKLTTAGFVFCFNFGARKALLFTRQRKATNA